MGHRNMFNTPQILETESHQGRDHTEQPYLLMGRASSSESSSLVQPTHPGQNISINGGPFPPPWPAAPRSRINSSSIPPVELPCFQQQAPGPSRDPFLHQPAGGNFHMVPDNYSRPPSSSSLSGQTIPGAHGGFVNPATMSSSRGPYKRKSPSTPQLYDRGSTSRYYDVGSSSNLLLPADPWQQKQTTESYHMPWEYHPGHRVNSLSIGGEDTQRNVRSRTVVNQEPNLARTHMPSNSMNRSFSNCPADRSNLPDYLGQTSNISMADWNHCLISPAGHGAPRGADSSSFGHGPNTNNALNSHANGSVDGCGYNNNASMPQNNYVYLNQPRREVQSSYERSAPTFRASSSNFYPGQVAASGEGPVMASDSFPSRHSQAFSTAGFRYSERNGRTGISSDRYRPFAEESSAPDRAAHEDIMAASYSTYYGSRAPYDQHREMRLDIDNMSYEELLALGESIGSVSTGLSDGLVSKCLTQSIYCSSDQFQDDATCVICLEEYMDKDDVGSLKCGHDFHVGCIRKWLSMKNLCPICKQSAVNDSINEELSS
ncbi:probable E3 ubiquitin-protein ligase ZFP1 [Salvia miltiorrhiza]|uniref:probable E3 ubiquitin-protein ligase ZFP1 n=1 Tax=Salvia miltiorrhiza TaxID=226208 RepID=UPI0025AC7E56|nr:probable E3 ubiquitin-protein ligase ZFP1 [Salvia miltiorrhiza]XP_057805460.1 probable E3 ubiquitin-protein ligase ZFP1 [Salvia miltiorrhiza]XP_057805461.1 probable E3 ubiquitin-protein ligase ZFP1 [Salvia miltiorrhiza]XP_057805462.1 probable E3 ubiquitin-protein ligase ZFP1 [Salvia miltiorrhiza]XP_057805463.1 probable E3 ubiquitin-protein ligase ZFP1 [Salvia miltiorrhiza]XP_057805464.1 probable E3 ubiquitin-protein ligase ZFP1 [Salvia miltiorrhiza]XP_057805465.1 probable E3 ubiquitin-prot